MINKLNNKFLIRVYFFLIRILEIFKIGKKTLSIFFVDNFEKENGWMYNVRRGGCI